MPLTKQIDSLSVQYQQERESKQRLSIILWIAIPFAVLLLLFVIFLYRARNKEKKYTKEIYRKNVELSETFFAKTPNLTTRCHPQKLTNSTKPFRDRGRVEFYRSEDFNLRTQR